MMAGAKDSVAAMNNKPLEGEVVNTGGVASFQAEFATIIQNFTMAFQNGYSVEEACQLVGIHRATFYRWLEREPVFKKRMDEARHMPNRRAKEVVIAAIDAGDTSSARWWLERRDPEFKAKGELEINASQTEEKLKEFMDDTDDDAYSSSPAEQSDAASVEPPATPQPEGGAEVAQSPSDI